MKRLNKKGFTLTELLAVILIISLLIGLSTTVFISIRNNALEKDYENLVTYLETKAGEYANKTGITTVSVEDLIKAGIIKADDGNDIYDPRDNSSLNCYIITSTYKDGGYTSSFGKNLGQEDNKCKTYEPTIDFQICKYDGEDCITDGISSWIKTTDGGIILGVKKGIEVLSKDNWTFNWKTTGGATSNESTIKVNANLISEVTVSVEATNPTDLTKGSARTQIKIDNQKPVVSNISYETKWTNEDKKISFNVSDFNGSGIKGVFVGTKEEYSADKINDSNINNGTYEISKSIGTYYIWVQDNVGNIYTTADDSKVPKIEIKNIDKQKPKIVVKDKNLKFPVSTNYDLLNNISVTDEGGSKISEVIAYINDKAIKNIKDLKVGKYNVVYKAKDNAGNETINNETTLIIFLPEKNIDYEDKEIDYVIPVDGAYQINLWGAQGSGSGGKGAYLSTEVNLKKGNILKITIGGQDGFNGGGVGASGTYNGGGATTVKLNGSYLVRAAGGGGGSNGTAGGSGNGYGGASVGNGAGVNGTNSGGGSSSSNYKYSCNCETCKTSTCKQWGDRWCEKSVLEDDGVWRCHEYGGPNCLEYETTTCNCGTCTRTGNSGNGGSNYIASSVKILESKEGTQSGNGKAQIKYVIK